MLGRRAVWPPLTVHPTPIPNRVRLDQWVAPPGGGITVTEHCRHPTHTYTTILHVTVAVVVRGRFYRLNTEALWTPRKSIEWYRDIRDSTTHAHTEACLIVKVFEFSYIFRLCMYIFFLVEICAVNLPLEINGRILCMLEFLLSIFFFCYSTPKNAKYTTIAIINSQDLYQ